MTWFSDDMTTDPSGPLILVATNRLKPGKLDAERTRVAGLAAFLEEQEPRLLAFNEYVNADATEVTVVQVHPDAASLQTHLGVVAESAAAAYSEILDATVAVQIYGPADPAMLDTLRGQTGPGMTLTVATDHLGGFVRTA